MMSPRGTWCALSRKAEARYVLLPAQRPVHCCIPGEALEGQRAVERERAEGGERGTHGGGPRLEHPGCTFTAR